MKRFTVVISRTEIYYKTFVDVEGKTAKEAELKALDQAGDVDFHSEGTSSSTPEYRIEVIKRRKK